MGANIEILNKDIVCNEEVADIKISYSENMQGITIDGEIHNYSFGISYKYE